MNSQVLLTIILMAVTTYLTRLGGYFALRNRVLSPKSAKILEAVPGCVLISVIAPHFSTGHPADLASLAITLVAACRFSMLPTVLLGVTSAGVLRHIL